VQHAQSETLFEIGHVARHGRMDMSSVRVAPVKLPASTTAANTFIS
jgi:hypothetical protein